jgi:uncharacterized membrane protein YhaH (DUF805 family)
MPVSVSCRDTVTVSGRYCCFSGYLSGLIASKLTMYVEGNALRTESMQQQLFRLFFTFKSRLARSSFWWGCIACWVGFVVLFVFLAASLGRPSTWMLYPPFAWMIASLLVKRLHDRGSSGWQLLWVLVPVLGPLWLVYVLGIGKGTAGDNQYGPDPLLVNVDYLRVDMP